ncbi:class I SAM-dependent RNA methyltransferase [Gordonia alkaliphila]|uniref:class I SAM-dependent RNA methyltransferase n=1 Tax=Gordonia alkaliphila TaxID=1053547 RepID=UPI0031EC18C8
MTAPSNPASSNPAPSTLDLTVTGFANGGAGVAHADDGRVVFVAGALPGERVRARIDEQKAAFARAVTLEVLDASPHRIDPSCPASAAGAGCCDLSYVSAEYARELHAGVLADVLTRLGRFGPDDPAPAAPTVTALGPDADGWRVRTRLAVGADGAVGLRERGSSDLITTPCVAPVDGLLAGAAALGAVPGSELVLAMGSDGRRHAAQLSPVARPRRGGRRASAQRARHSAGRDRTTRVLEGDGAVTQTVGGHTWSIPVTGFWQAHRSAPATYAETVRRYVGAVDGLPAGLRVWDLYGGAGVLGAGLLDGALPVAHIDLVETDPGALAAAADALGDAPVTAHRGDSAAVIGGLSTPDVVIVDPPRRGAGAAVVAAIAAAQPRAVVHVGCDAAAFARDLRDYVTHGYRVTAWQGFDAFPRTRHMEAIALLESP